jgi:hypothetical protein
MPFCVGRGPQVAAATIPAKTRKSVHLIALKENEQGFYHSVSTQIRATGHEPTVPIVMCKVWNGLLIFSDAECIRFIKWQR